MREQEQVECGEHGGRSAAFMCRHLTEGSRRGFHYSDDDPDALWPAAWCSACDAIASEEGGWTERAVERAGADVRVVCDACYDLARARNWREPRGKFDRLLERASAWLEPRQQRLTEQFRIRDFPRWDWNQDTRQLIFSGAGKRRLVADFVFAGSLSTRSNTWMWSWANESDQEPLKAPLRRVRAYGEKHRLLKLVGALWSAQEHDAWQMTTIAAHLLDAQAVYRTPSEDVFCYLLLTRIHAEH